jgi:hypothetical protein
MVIDKPQQSGAHLFNRSLRTHRLEIPDSYGQVLFVLERGFISFTRFKSTNDSFDLVLGTVHETFLI